MLIENKYLVNDLNFTDLILFLFFFMLELNKKYYRL